MRRLLLALALLVLAQPAAGKPSSAWQIVQSVGEVSVQHGGFLRVALDPKAALPEGAVVNTGANGRVVMRRGAETITLDPMSRVVLCDDTDLVTRIRQESGTALFRIGKRRAPHFEVDTRFLAAVVKGTVFRVTVADDATDVTVEEGAVEVATRSRSAVTLVKPGATALVRSDGDGEIRLLKNGRLTRTVTGDDGGWSGPSVPGDDGGGSGPSSTGSDGARAPHTSAGRHTGGAGLLRKSDGGSETSPAAYSSAPASAALGEPPTRERGVQGASFDGGGTRLTETDVFEISQLRPRIADVSALSQFGSMPGTTAMTPGTVSGVQLYAAGRAVSHVADAAVASTGKIAAAVHNAARPKTMKTTAELPLREIAVCFLAVMALMLARRVVRLLQSAKGRG